MKMSSSLPHLNMKLRRVWRGDQTGDGIPCRYEGGKRGEIRTGMEGKRSSKQGRKDRNSTPSVQEQLLRLQTTFTLTVW